MLVCKKHSSKYIYFDHPTLKQFVWPNIDIISVTPVKQYDRLISVWGGGRTFTLFRAVSCTNTPFNPEKKPDSHMQNTVVAIVH